MELGRLYLGLAVPGEIVLIDAHAHLEKYDDDELDDVLATIAQRQILTLSVSEDVASFERTQAIATRSRFVVAGFGIHPWRAPDFVGSLPALEEVVNRSPFVGEIGLDYRFVTEAAHYEPQRQVFSTLLAMAKEQGKLVNVHCAGAEQDTADILGSSQIERVIIHWYSGPIDVLTQMVEQGFMFTIGIELLYSDQIRDVARTIPDHQLLTETDNPGGVRWLTGRAGTPDLIADIVDELAKVRGVSSEEVASTVHTNLARLFENDRHLAGWSAPPSSSAPED